MLHPRAVYDTWYDCAQAGYREAALIMKNYDPKIINDNKIAVKFECKELTKLKQENT